MDSGVVWWLCAPKTAREGDVIWLSSDRSLKTVHLPVTRVCIPGYSYLLRDSGCFSRRYSVSSSRRQDTDDAAK